MFNLEKAIQQWRRELAVGDVIDAAALDEMEGHLRDAIEERVRAGAAPEIAFREAAAELGDADALLAQFEIGRGFLPQRAHLVKVAAVALVAFSALLTMAFFSPTEARKAMAVSLALGIFVLFLGKFLAALRMRGVEPDFSRLSASALQAVELARAEAPALGHDFVGTEHLLLGICGEIPELLGSFGLRREQIREQIEKIVGVGSAHENRMPPFTPRAKQALRLAAAESRQMRHSRTQPEHLFLGLLLEPSGVATRVLHGLGVNVESARECVRKTLRKTEI
jgi:hypothetical protein